MNAIERNVNCRLFYFDMLMFFKKCSEFLASC